MTTSIIVIDFDLDSSNPYEVLGVDSEVSFAELRDAYRRLVKQYHPDRTGGDDTFMKKINAAWEKIKNPDVRNLYDETGGSDIEPHIYQKVRAWAVSLLVEEALQHPKRDPQTAVVKEIKQKIHQARSNIKEKKHAVKKLKQTLARFTHKSGKALLHKMLEDHISMAHESMVTSQKEIICLKKARNHIQGYDYDAPELTEEEKIEKETRERLETMRQNPMFFFRDFK